MLSFAAAGETAALPSRDFYCAEPALGLFAVTRGIDADPDSGGLLSRIAGRALRQYIAETAGHDTQTRLSLGLKVAEESVAAILPTDGPKRGVRMCAVLFDSEYAVSVSVGCSIYVMRKRQLFRVMARRASGPAFSRPERLTEITLLDGSAGSHPDIARQRRHAGDRWLLFSGETTAPIDRPDTQAACVSNADELAAIAHHITRTAGCAIDGEPLSLLVVGVG